MDVFMGTIMTFAFPYAPSGWALCNGQILNINQYNALFALLGVTYGGNGSTTFALPNLQGRSPLCQGQGTNLAARVMGNIGGIEAATANISNMPPHVHPLSSLTATTTITLANPSVNPTIAPSTSNAYIGASTAGPTSANIFSTDVGATPVTQKGVTTAVNGTMGIQGGGLPMDIMNPFLVVNFSIALQGIWPPRE